MIPRLRSPLTPPCRLLYADDESFRAAMEAHQRRVEDRRSAGCVEVLGNMALAAATLTMLGVAVWCLARLALGTGTP